MTRILVTGASGLLGLNLALEAARRYEVVGILHKQRLLAPGFETIEADLLEPDAIARVLDDARPDWVVNCAALADLDACERNPELAQRLNVELPARLAAETIKRGLRFLHVSSDAVFDGSKGNYEETDAPNPLSVYGRTKRLAELAVKAAYPQWLVVRPNLFGWSASGDRSLAEFFYNSLAAGSFVQGFTDRSFSPLYVGELANILLSLLEKNAHGIFHAGSSDAVSKFDFGVALARRFGLNEQLVQPAAATQTSAPRAKNLSLNTRKLASLLGRRLPSVAEGIGRLHAQLVSGHRDKLLAMMPLTVKG